MQHRHGIGTRLLYEQIAAAIDDGRQAVSLEVRVTNWGAQRLYGRFGFHPVGIRRNYYQELHEDALIMWTDDIRTRVYRARLDGHRGRAMPGRWRRPRDHASASRPPATRPPSRSSRTASRPRRT